MSSRIKHLFEHKLISPQKWIIDNLHYETIVGSISYGVSNDDKSDEDIYAVTIPPKNILFPHLDGHIKGFGKLSDEFHQFQKPHIVTNTWSGGKTKEFDVSIYNIVKYFQLCMECNPNMIDSLFTPIDCVTHCTTIGHLLRENRKLFLHKGAWFKFKGYAYSQLHKVRTIIDLNDPIRGKEIVGKRRKLIEEFGFDVKYCYHVCRLLNEVQQILENGDLDLRQNSEQLKAIRRGEWTVEQIKELFTKKEAELETLYNKSSLQHSPDENKIKQLLLDCLEHHYGNLNNCITIPNLAEKTLIEIKFIIENYTNRQST